MVQHGTLVHTELENGCSNLGRDTVKPGRSLTTIEIKLLPLTSFHLLELQWKQHSLLQAITLLPDHTPSLQTEDTRFRKGSKSITNLA